MNFEDYLTSKKIDAAAFEKAESALFHSWKTEFEQMHANSFTVQKLNLINPIRRKYQLLEPPVARTEDTTTPPSTTVSPARGARPVFKPKIN